MTKEELAKLQAAAEVLDDNGREILAEQIWWVFEAEGGERETIDPGDTYTGPHFREQDD